jgi:serine/threonine protein kinase
MSTSSDPPGKPSLPSPLGKIDEIADQFEAAWKKGEAPSIAAFLGDATGAFRVDLLDELVEIDRTYRRRAGQDDGADKYLREYPELVGSPPETLAWSMRPTAHAGMAATSPAEPAPGSRLGSYDLLDRLGGGGMGVVFRARHVLLKKEFALKVLSPRLARHPEVVRRFLREMEAIGRLEHANLVRASDAAVGDGVPFLVMELLDGTDLARLTERIGPWPVAEACAAVQQAAIGLQHVYEQGMVHRDIKPSNLLLTRSAVVKVLDLGLAQLDAGMESTGMTEAGRMLGTPDYVAPEQVLDSHAVDIRADLYSLGCTLFQLLTGEPPFGKATHPTLGRKREAHLTESAPDIRTRRPEAPMELAAVLSRLLAKRPEERYATPAEVAAALEPFAAGVRLEHLLDVDQPATRPQPLVCSAPSATMPALTPAKAWMSRRRWLALGTPLVAAGVLVPLGWRWLRQPEITTPPSRLEPLSLRSFRVWRYANSRENPELLGELGENTYRALYDDQVEVEAELSEPAYAYLLACNPTVEVGKQIQLCLLADENTLPEIGPRVSYQSVGKRFVLNDGAGLQAFVLLASRQPLPAYAQWRKETPALPWKRVPATAGIVWRGDGLRLERLMAPGDLRGTEVALEEFAVLEKLNRQLRSDVRIETAALIAFAAVR